MKMPMTRHHPQMKMIVKTVTIQHGCYKCPLLSVLTLCHHLTCEYVHFVGTSGAATCAVFSGDRI
jgi:hypothetical protein